MFAGQLIFKQVMKFMRQLLWYWGDSRIGERSKTL